MGKNFNSLAVVGALGIASFAVLQAVGEIDLLPDCVAQDSHCFGWAGRIIDKVFGDDQKSDDDQHEQFSSNVVGGISAFRIPLNDRVLYNYIYDLNPLEITKDGKVAYSSTEKYMVSEIMRGEVVAIVDESGPEKEVYVVGVDTKGTPDASDDTVRPIDLNDFDTFSLSTTKPQSSPMSKAEDYKNCIEKLEAGDTDYLGCALTTVEGDDDADLPYVLDNVRAQYVGDESCAARTMILASNLANGKTAAEPVGGHRAPDDWTEIQPDTVTIVDVAAVAIERQTGDLLRIDPDHIHAIMATNPDGTLVQWDGDTQVDLAKVEELSDGKYKAQDVHVAQDCLRGRWSFSSTPEEVRAYMKEEGMLGKELLDPKWFEGMKFTPEPMPDTIGATLFNADGTFIAAPSPAPAG